MLLAMRVPDDKQASPLAWLFEITYMYCTAKSHHRLVIPRIIAKLHRIAYDYRVLIPPKHLQHLTRRSATAKQAPRGPLPLIYPPPSTSLTSLLSS